MTTKMVDLQTDATSIGENLGPQFELQLSKQLTNSNLRVMKFLLWPHMLSTVQFEEIKTTFQLFCSMKQKGLLSQTNKQLLGELFYFIHKIKLLKMLGYDPRQFKQTMESGHHRLSPYKVLLIKLYYDIDSKDMDLLKIFALGKGYLGRHEADKVHDVLFIFMALEDRQIMACDDLSCLSEMLQSIERWDLLTKLKQYEGHCEPDRSNGGQQGQTSSADAQNHVGRPDSVERVEAARRDPNSAANVMVNKGMAQVTETQNPAPSNLEGIIAEVQQMQIKPEQQQTPKRSQEDEDMPCYKMDRLPRGYCLIINNEHFGGKIEQRIGTQFDEAKLSAVFTELGFQLVIKRDLTAAGMRSWLKAYAFKQNHDTFDCFACCILTHGDTGRLFGTDGEAVEIKDLTGYFRPHSCPSLSRKPKLFFMQACQGSQRQHVFDDLQIDGPSGDGQSVAVESDFLLGYATVPGFVSYRNKSSGSWYITKLVEMLRRYSSRYDLLSILTKVNEELSRAKASIGGHYFGQVPAPLHTLTKRVFFGQPTSTG